MCTLGVVGTESGEILAFKNCDAIGTWHYPEPQIVDGPRQRFLEFSSTPGPFSSGLWLAVNRAGLCLMGADANAVSDLRGEPYAPPAIVGDLYREAVGICSDAHEAAAYLARSYQERMLGGPGDIVLLADRKVTVVLEYQYGEIGLRYRCCGQPFLVQSNFFQVLRHLRPAPESSPLHISSALRYQRATGLLSRTTSRTTVEDLQALLCDHQNGPSAVSICRHGGPGEYVTQASAVVTLGAAGEVSALYAIGGPPCQQRFRRTALD